MSAKLQGGDPRLTPARGDLAAAYLRDRVTAERYVTGEPLAVVVEIADLKREPRPDAPLDTQLLYGQTVTIYDEDNGWAWVQSEADGYVGYVARAALAASRGAPTHRVIVNRTFVYPAPNLKAPILGALPLDARVRVGPEPRGNFAALDGHGFVFAAHLAPLAGVRPDYVATAEKLMHTPYLWGGKSSAGIDCSGLVQLACALAHLNMPRDTDLQEAVWPAIPVAPELTGLRRGDLVFWKGHVGLMQSATDLLHANAYHMLVSSEPLSNVRDRVASSSGGITSIRRPNV